MSNLIVPKGLVLPPGVEEKIRQERENEAIVVPDPQEECYEGFLTLQHCMEVGNTELILAKDKRDGTVVPVICAGVKTPQGTLQYVPLAVIVDKTVAAFLEPMRQKIKVKDETSTDPNQDGGTAGPARAD